MPIIHFTKPEMAKARGKSARTITAHLEKFRIEPDGQRLDGTPLYSGRLLLELIDKEQELRLVKEVMAECLAEFSKPFPVKKTSHKKSPKKSP